MKNFTRARIALAASAVFAAFGIAACGGDDSDDSEALPAHTLTDVRACFEDEGQKVRDVEVSFAKIPPDIGVSSKAGSANVWVRPDADGAQEVVAQAESLSDLGDQSLPDSEIAVSGNAVATISSSSSPDYAEVVETCLPEG